MRRWDESSAIHAHMQRGGVGEKGNSVTAMRDHPGPKDHASEKAFPHKFRI